MVGSVFNTVSLVAKVSVPLLVSVTVTEHSTISFGPTVVGDNDRESAVDANGVFALRFVQV